MQVSRTLFNTQSSNVELRKEVQTPHATEALVCKTKHAAFTPVSFLAGSLRTSGPARAGLFHTRICTRTSAEPPNTPPTCSAVVLGSRV